MKLNIKPNLKTIFTSIYILILIIDIIAFYFLFGFLNTNVLKTISSESNLAGVPSAQLSDDINTSHFDTIVENIKNKTRH